MENDPNLVIATYQQLLANATHQMILAETKAQGLERANAVLQARLDAVPKDTDGPMEESSS